MAGSKTTDLIAVNTLGTLDPLYVAKAPIGNKITYGDLSTQIATLSLPVGESIQITSDKVGINKAPTSATLDMTSASGQAVAKLANTVSHSLLTLSGVFGAKLLFEETGESNPWLVEVDKDDFLFKKGTLTRLTLTNTLATFNSNLTTTGTLKVGSLSGILSATAGTVSALSTGLENLTTDEVSQLANIDANTISGTQWGYLGGMNQPVTTSSDVGFAGLTINNPNSSDSLVINASVTQASIFLNGAAGTGGKLNFGNSVDLIGDTGGLTVNAPSANNALKILADGKTGFGFATPLSRVAINGGLHVGGESDAGDNNLLVDGTARITTSIATATLVPLTTDPSNAITVFGGTDQDNWINYRTGGGLPRGRAGNIFSRFSDVHYFMCCEEDSTFRISYSTESSGAPDVDSSTARFVMDPNGNVGIGTINPIRKVHIEDSSDDSPQSIALTRRGSPVASQEYGSVEFGGEAGGFRQLPATITAASETSWFTSGGLNQAVSGQLQFKTLSSTNSLANDSAVPTTKMTITGNGNVGIGTTNPTAGSRLEVVGGDIRTSTAGNGLIVRTPDNTKSYRISVNNAGTIISTLV
jgi:hypothetical protein